MQKPILGVVLGYIAMMILFFAVFTALYLLLGADRVFGPATAPIK